VLFKEPSLGLKLALLGEEFELQQVGVNLVDPLLEVG
jgi:hypothetical protein